MIIGSTLQDESLSASRVFRGVDLPLPLPLLRTTYPKIPSVAFCLFRPLFFGGGRRERKSFWPGFKESLGSSVLEGELRSTEASVGGGRERGGLGVGKESAKLAGAQREREGLELCLSPGSNPFRAWLKRAASEPPASATLGTPPLPPPPAPRGKICTFKAQNSAALKIPQGRPLK